MPEPRRDFERQVAHIEAAHLEAAPSPAAGVTPALAGRAAPLANGSRLVLASHNKGKLRELAALLAPFGIDLVSAASLGLPEPEETAPDFAGNAQLKARAAAMASGLPALADDSGFCVAALGGAPGVLSARWAELGVGVGAKVGVGAGRDFGAAMARVYAEAAGAADRRAWFVCTLCLAWPDGSTATYLGRVEGGFVWPPRGALGFGYDPMFVPAGGTRTYGEIEPDQKHATSHRARAMAQFTAACLGGPVVGPGGNTGGPNTRAERGRA